MNILPIYKIEDEEARKVGKYVKTGTEDLVKLCHGTQFTQEVIIRATGHTEILDRNTIELQYTQTRKKAPCRKQFYIKRKK